MKHIIVAGLLRSGGRILLCHRSPDREAYPGVWDFPGGHVELREMPEEAFGRELFEELGIQAQDVSRTPIIHRRVPESELDLRVWLIDSWIGTVANRQLAEHDAIGWFAHAELESLTLADPSYQAVLQDALADG